MRRQGDRSTGRHPCRPDAGWTGAIATALALALVVSLVPVATAAQTTQDSAEESVVVSLDGDGDAALSLVIPFDLTDAEQRAAFEEFSTDQARQRTLVEQYETRVSNVAAELDNRTAREMRVTDPRIEARTDDSGTVGYVEVTVTWERLAAADGDRLKLREPFDSGFAPDARMTVEAPENHRFVSTTPEATIEDGTAVWRTDQALDNFDVTVAPTDTSTDDESGGETTADGAESPASPDENGAGFGVLVALVAVGALLLASRRN